MFGQMDIDDPVVVQCKSFTKSVLRNFKTSIKVSFEWSGEVEIKEESQVALVQCTA